MSSIRDQDNQAKRVATQGLSNSEALPLPPPEPEQAAGEAPGHSARDLRDHIRDGAQRFADYSGLSHRYHLVAAAASQRRARSNRREAKLNDAIRHLESAYNLAPTNVRTMMRLGRAYDLAGQTKDALATYVLALSELQSRIGSVVRRTSVMEKRNLKNRMRVAELYLRVAEIRGQQASANPQEAQKYHRRQHKCMQLAEAYNYELGEDIWYTYETLVASLMPHPVRTDLELMQHCLNQPRDSHGGSLLSRECLRACVRHRLLLNRYWDEHRGDEKVLWTERWNTNHAATFGASHALGRRAVVLKSIRDRSFNIQHSKGDVVGKG